MTNAETTTTTSRAINTAVIVGELSSDPVSRELPSGDLLTQYEVAVRSEGHPADTVPVVCFAASQPSLSAGERVVAVGRVRRRFFRAGGATASRTEVVADAVIPARQLKRSANAIAAVVQDLAV
jgi:single-strand DNA-binding protein